jgi:hypothetical protein
VSRSPHPETVCHSASGKSSRLPAALHTANGTVSGAERHAPDPSTDALGTDGKLYENYLQANGWFGWELALGTPPIRLTEF